MRRMLAWLVAGSVCLPVGAQWRPLGTEFRIAPDNLTECSVAMAADGSFVALYPELDLWPLPPLYTVVQRFDPAGRPRGAPIPIDEYDRGWAGYRSIAASPRGSFMVTGTQFSTETSRYLMYDSSGLAIAHGVFAAPRAYSSIGADSSGRFAIAWDRLDAIYAQVIDAEGHVAVAPFVVAPVSEGFPWVLAAQPDREGRFVVLWRRYPGGTYGRRFSANGDPLGDVFEIPVPATAAVGDSLGNFALLWQVVTPRPTRWLARRYSPEGAPLGPSWEAIAEPEIGMVQMQGDAAGNLLVAHSKYTPDRTSNDLLVQAFRPDGTRNGPELQLNAKPGGWHSKLSSAISIYGHAVFAWVSEGTATDEDGIYARLYHVPAKGDFDGDLNADLALRHMETGATRLWRLVEGTCTGDFMVWPPTPGPEWALVGADDFSGDHRQDLVFRHGETGEVLFKMLGGEFGNECVASAPLNGGPVPTLEWELVATGDFDHDGWPDLVWQHSVTRQVVVWTMVGTTAVGLLTPTPDRPADANWSVVAAVDWNGDGTRDLLWYNAASGSIVQWLLDAALVRTEGRFTNPPRAADPNWNVVAAGDYGLGLGAAPGTNDIVWRNITSGRQVIWFLDAAGNRTAGRFTNPAAPTSALWVACGPR